MWSALLSSTRLSKSHFFLSLFTEWHELAVGKGSCQNSRQNIVRIKIYQSFFRRRVKPIRVIVWSLCIESESQCSSNNKLRNRKGLLKTVFFMGTKFNSQQVVLMFVKHYMTRQWLKLNQNRNNTLSKGYLKISDLGRCLCQEISVWNKLEVGRNIVPYIWFLYLILISFIVRRYI